MIAGRFLTENVGLEARGTKERINRDGEIISIRPERQTRDVKLIA